MRSEQNAPKLIVFSDPSIPDRTSSLREENHRKYLLDEITKKLGVLISLNVDHVVICCVTVHALLPDLPQSVQEKITSLVTVILSEVLASSEKHLLLCSSGSRECQLFESHELWPRSESQIIMPTYSDQRRIQKLIYDIKENRVTESQYRTLPGLLEKYNVQSYICGCTELHVYKKLLFQRAAHNFRCIDPLQSIADHMRR